MSTNHETFYRLWHVLRQLPRYPHKATVQAIEAGLKGIGVNVTGRTIQRDLIDLSRLFPIVVDDRSKPYGWSWQKDVKCFDLPGLSIEEALAWILVEQHLKQLMPNSAIDHLQRYFNAAHERLDDEPTPQRGHSWLNKVRTVLPNQALIPPDIDPQVQKAVSEALLHEKRLEVRYRKKGERQSSRYLLHPLALILRGSVLYLYARLFDYPNARNLALHRIESATVLDEPAIPPEGFDLDDKIAQGIWDFGAGELIKLRLRFWEWKGEHLNETALSRDQVIEENPDNPDCLTVSATVADTPQLRWWLLGFGAGIEVLEPISLRQNLSQEIVRMAERYACQENVEI